MFASRVILAAFLAAVASSAPAPSLEGSTLPRGIGSLACNVARIKIVGALGDAGSSIGDVQDPAVQTAATAGLDQANGGIKQIASAIISGAAPPQTSRDQVEAGLTAMGAALTGSNSTDPAVVDAQSALAKAVQAGQDVVSEC